MASNWQDTYEKLKKQKEVLDLLSRNDIVSNMPKKSNTSTSSSKKKDEDDTWFKSGAFDDGYQIGDITKTILGTVGDVGVGVVKGVGNLAEGVLDLGTYAASGVADLFGNEEASERIKRRGQETLVNDWLAPLENKVDSNSLLGNKADNITQGLGYVGGILLTGGLGASAGLGTVGTTALTTGLTGVSGMGSGMSEAYQGGATDKEALTYGTITGLAEAGTELIFGGLGKAVNATGLSVGLSSADDMLAKKISSKFSNQIAKNFTEFGVKAGAEGLEEVMSGFIQGVGKYYTYQTEQDGFNLKQIIEDEKLLDQFIAGAVTSGIAQSGIVPGMKNGSLIEANKTGRDFVTGYTQNEQAVIDNEIAKRTEGKELTNKQKSKIEAEVIEDLEKGYISTDTIESTLGGKTYNQLKSVRDHKTNLENQIKELENKPNAEITVAEMERLNDLREQLSKSNTNTLESKLQAEMGDRIKSDGFLQRSYQEKAKRSKEFTYKAAETDSEFRKGVLESTKGKLNDTTRSHETAEALVKLSEDRKMQYKFTNTKELQQMKLVPEGKTANGLYVVEKDGKREILVNTDSKKYVEAVLVHETAHDFQTTSPETYTKLKDITKEFAEASGDYARIHSEVTEMYKNVEGVNIEEEVTSRLLEDYLGNKDFVSSLSTKEPNIVKKIIDEIKYLYKKFTAGSPEARKLVELQHTLEKTYREAYKQTKTTKTTESVKYSVSDVENMSEDTAIKTMEQLEAIEKTRELNPDEKDLRQELINKYLLQSDKFGEYVRGWADRNRSKNKTNDTPNIKKYDTKQSDIQGLEYYKQEDIEDAILEDIEDKLRQYGYEEEVDSIYLHGSRMRGTAKDTSDLDVVMFYKGEADDVGMFNDLNASRLEIDGIEVDINPINLADESAESYIKRSEAYDKKIIANGGVKYSLDNQGRELSEGQQEYFKDSKAREDDGSLTTVYHTMTDGGTQFNEFNPVGTDGYRFGDKVVNYFTDSKDMSGSYSYQKYNMADTKKLNSIAEVEKWLEDNRFDGVVQYDYELKKVGNDYNLKLYHYENGYKFIDETLSESDLLKRTKNLVNSYVAQNQRYQYEGYANLTNPLIVDAEGRNWNRVSKEYSQKIYDRYNSLNQIEKDYLMDLASWGDSRVFKTTLEDAHKDINIEHKKGMGEDVEALASAFKKLRGLDNFIDDVAADLYDVYVVAQDDFSNESMKENALMNLSTNHIVEKALKDGSYDGVIIKNVIDYGSGTSQEAANVYVTFSSEQFKAWDNLNPTTDKDIRYSLSEETYSKLENERQIVHMGNVLGILNSGTFSGSVAIQNAGMKPSYYKGYKEGIVFKPAAIEYLNTQKLYKGDGGNNGYVRENPNKYSSIEDFINEDTSKRQITKYNEGIIEKDNQIPINSETVDYILIDSNTSQELIDKAKDMGFDVRYSTQKGQYSLSEETDIAPTSTPNQTAAQDIKLQVEEAIAPLQEEITQLKEELRNITDVDYAPATQEVVEQQGTEAFNTLDDSNMPIEVEEIAPVSDKLTPTDSLFDTRDYEEVGSKKVNAYQYDNPEVRPYFQEAARGMLADLQNSTRGERYIIGDASQMGDNDYYYSGTKRFTTNDIADLLDGMGGKYKYTYAEIEKGLRAIIEDNGAENNAVSKRIEFYLDKRLREGYTDIDGYEIPADTEYLDMLRAKGITDYYNNIPLGEAPVENVDKPVDNVSNSKAPLKLEAIRPAPDKDTHGYSLIRVKTDAELQTEANQEIAEILTEEPTTENKRNKRKWAILKANVFDKGMVFEDVALKHKNRELMGKWDYTLTAEARGQNVIGNGHYEYDPYSKTTRKVSKSLNEIREEVESTGLTKEFYEYMYHKHNIDRMRLDKLYETENKPVFGYNVTADQSVQKVREFENLYPDFMLYAQDVYDYLEADRNVLVENGVISEETAQLWQDMYPHYVPIRRAGHTGLNINVPLDTGRTGVNAPIKKATGGNQDILPLFDTMASRTLQTYRATAKNSFGVELKNTIGTTINSQTTNIDEVIDSVDAQEGLLQEGKNGQKPTFTVFEDGEKVTFEITEDMYDALKPLDNSSLLSKTFLPFNKASNFHRGLLTEYNPVFMLTNGIKDAQDILINSQHAAKTYAKVPEAFAQLVSKGYWYQEYMANGGEQNSYFDSVENTFKTENKGLAKMLDLPPLKTISQLNNFIERTPRLAEYIASREAGKSIEVAMLDAARVTTNFKAGGNLTKWANRNGATFLNASVQGAMQQVRNIREANANGIRGWANLATKFAIAGVPAMLLNALLWEDDEDYEELSDYVKQNYYIVAKNDDGTFIRIPKGRTLAVIQEGMQQMKNLATGDDEADLKAFIDLFLTNLAPNNPIENNILSPVIQVANNKTWYGEDLVPMRLQDLPAAEQYDESTDSFSRWLGEKTNISPVKINYLLDQYSGGLGDVVLPMMTPEAKSDADTLGEQLLAPLRNKFTVSGVMNNQNVADFYDTSEELTTNAKKSNATDEDILSNKYINSIKAEMNELYAEKREIQNSDLSNSEKYRQVLEVQTQINELTKEALNSYKDVNVYSNYATAGDRQYRINSDGEWQKINDKQLEKQDEVTSTLGISPNDYWGNKEEYDYAYENPSKYAIANAIADYSTYKQLSSELYDIKADKDENGKSISGSRKEKVFDYINNLDLDFEQRVMLAKLEYPSYDEYNYEIIEYLNNREDISREQMEAILTELGFTVKKDGTIVWD